MKNNHQTRHPQLKGQGQLEILITILRDVGPAGFISYHDIESKAGFNPRVARGMRLRKAREILVVEQGIVFDVVPGEGIRRLTENEKFLVARRGMNQINRIAAKCHRVLATTNADRLSNDELEENFFNQAQCAMVSAATSNHGQAVVRKKLKDKFRKPVQQLPAPRRKELMHQMFAHSMEAMLNVT